MEKQDILKKIESLEKEIKDLKDNIDGKSKEQEMSNFLFSMLNGTIMKFTGEKEITYYRASDNEWLFQQDSQNGYLWVRDFLILPVFVKKFNLNHQEIIDFIEGWIEINTKWQKLTPKIWVSNFNGKVETNSEWRW